MRGRLKSIMVKVKETHRSILRLEYDPCGVLVDAGVVHVKLSELDDVPQELVAETIAQINSRAVDRYVKMSGEPRRNNPCPCGSGKKYKKWPRCEAIRIWYNAQYKSCGGGMKVNRQSGVGLVEQIVTLLKTEVSAGRYATGSRLPSALTLGKLLDVSEKPVRGALRQLAKEGWVKPVRGVGSVVLSRSVDSGNRGNVLIVYVSSYQSYFFSTMRESLRLALAKRGYRTSVALVNRQTERERLRDINELKEFLSRKWDLIVESGYREDVRELIEMSGIPFVSLVIRSTSPASPQACSTVFIRMGAGLGEFYRAVAKRNLHTAWQFLIGDGGFDVTESLRMVGCSVRTFRMVPRARDPFNAAACYVVSTLKMILQTRTQLPDVILFGDDHFCLPALATLLVYGKRVPDDVRVVTFSNKGDEPPFPKRLTRIELNVPEAVREMNNLVLSILKGKSVPSEVVVGSRWTLGETF